MADPTLVNGQITDAVTQSNVKVLGEAPALALGTVYQSLAQATGLAMQNAVSAQQQMNVIAQAVTAQAVSLLQGEEADYEVERHFLDDDDEDHDHDHDHAAETEPR